jgi:hypothetical protein
MSVLLSNLSENPKHVKKISWKFIINIFINIIIIIKDIDHNGYLLPDFNWKQ